MNRSFLIFLFVLVLLPCSLIFSQEFKNNPPKAPTNLSAQSGVGKAILKWQANSESDMNGYNVYVRQTDLTFMRVNPKLIQSVTSQITFQITGLGSGEQLLRVTAVDLAGNESEPSEIIVYPPKITANLADTNWPTTGGGFHNRRRIETLTSQTGSLLSESEIKMIFSNRYVTVASGVYGSRNILIRPDSKICYTNSGGYVLANNEIVYRTGSYIRKVDSDLNEVWQIKVGEIYAGPQMLHDGQIVCLVKNSLCVIDPDGVNARWYPLTVNGINTNAGDFVIDENSGIYIIYSEKRLHSGQYYFHGSMAKYNANGQRLWYMEPFSEGFRNAQIILLDNGTVMTTKDYGPYNKSSRICLAGDNGYLQWSKLMNSRSLPRSYLLPDSNIFMITEDKNMVIDYRNGNVLREFDSGWYLPNSNPSDYSSPICGKDGTVYFHRGNKVIYSYDSATLAMKWKYNLHNASFNSEISVDDGGLMIIDVHGASFPSAIFDLGD